MTAAELYEKMAMRLRVPVEIDEGKLQKMRERADRAQSLMQDEMLQEAFALVREAYMNEWASSDPFATETRERAWVAVKLLDDVRAHLIGAVRDGEVARRQLARLRGEA